MWKWGTFEAFGNHLRKFLHVCEDVLKGMDKRMGWMLVEINIKNVFLDENKIEWCERNIFQKLDY